MGPGFRVNVIVVEPFALGVKSKSFVLGTVCDWVRCYCLKGYFLRVVCNACTCGGRLFIA